MPFDKLSSAALLSACKKITEVAESDGKQPVCFSVVDETGELLVFHRMDGAPIRLNQIAVGKAYTAARMGVSTLAFHQRLVREKLSLVDFCDQRFTSLPGGRLIKVNERVLGAVGVSGRELSEDDALAEVFASVVVRSCEGVAN